MSFARAFISVIQNGLKNSISKGSIASPSRQFHAVMRPLPNSATGTSTLIQTAIVISAASQASAITGLKRLLVPVSTLINQVSGFKVKARLRRRCKDCYFVIRERRHYVICPTHRRHKQMSMKKRDYKSWILTHATQSKVRPY